MNHVLKLFIIVKFKDKRQEEKFGIAI
jgi:hypothetical protein